ncbi:MAG: mannonate dehydratase [Cypionkella sp.]
MTLWGIRRMSRQWGRYPMIEGAGFSWSTVESLLRHDRIKKADGDLSRLFANDRQLMTNLASQGAITVCHDYMPVMD